MGSNDNKRDNHRCGHITVDIAGDRQRQIQFHRRLIQHAHRERSLTANACG